MMIDISHIEKDYLLTCDLCLASEINDMSNKKSFALRPMYLVNKEYICCQKCLVLGKHLED